MKKSQNANIFFMVNLVLNNNSIENITKALEEKYKSLKIIKTVTYGLEKDGTATAVLQSNLEDLLINNPLPRRSTSYNLEVKKEENTLKIGQEHNFLNEGILYQIDTMNEGIEKQIQTKFDANSANQIKSLYSPLILSMKKKLEGLSAMSKGLLDSLSDAENLVIPKEEQLLSENQLKGREPNSPTALEKEINEHRILMIIDRLKSKITDLVRINKALESRQCFKVVTGFLDAPMNKMREFEYNELIKKTINEHKEKELNYKLIIEDLELQIKDFKMKLFKSDENRTSLTEKISTFNKMEDTLEMYKKEIERLKEIEESKTQVINQKNELISGLREKIKNLENETKSLQESNKSLIDAKEKQYEKLKTLLENKKKLKLIIKTLKSANLDTSKFIEEKKKLEDIIRSSENNLQDLNDKSQKQLIEIENLNKMNESLKKENLEYSLIKADLSKQITSLRKASEDFSEKYNQTDLDSKQNKEELNKIKEQDETLKRIVASNQQEFLDLKSENENLKLQISQQNDKILIFNEKMSIISNLDNNNKALVSQINTLSQEIKMFHDAISNSITSKDEKESVKGSEEMCKKIINLINEKQYLMKKVEKLEEQYKELSKNLDLSKKKYDEFVISQNAILKEYEDKIFDLEMKLRTSKEISSQVNPSSNKLILQKNIEISNMVNEMKELKLTVSDYEMKQDAQLKLLDDLKARLIKQKDKYKTKIAEIKSKVILDDNKGANDNPSSESPKSQGGSSKPNNNLQGKIFELTKEIGLLHEKISELEGKVKIKEKKFYDKDEEAEELKLKIETLHKEISSLKESHNTTLTNLVNETKQKEELKNKMFELQQILDSSTHLEKFRKEKKELIESIISSYKVVNTWCQERIDEKLNKTEKINRMKKITIDIEEAEKIDNSLKIMVDSIQIFQFLNGLKITQNTYLLILDILKNIVTNKENKIRIYKMDFEKLYGLMDDSMSKIKIFEQKLSIL